MPEAVRSLGGHNAPFTIIHARVMITMIGIKKSIIRMHGAVRKTTYGFQE